MEGEALKAGKARVRKYLIDELNARGMERKRAVKVEDFEKTMDSLAARLAYMDVEQLQALAEVVERSAGGKHKNAWPAEVSICNWARRIQQPPASDSRLIRSYLQSAAGRRAVAAGCVVELYWFLKKYGHPPNDYSMNQIRDEGAGNAAVETRILNAQETGRIDRSDIEWLDWYQTGRERVLAIVDAKQIDEVAA